ncbi:transcription repressor NadR [Clostridium saccharobutylicum]|uniref:Transcription repressor NiaR n=1 Tax=Clostridium saccharobutylicum DSM 13864 TaxID=1345695 RepID=U5MNT6_CLOSA|nr:transcription repressor NadR [Clostridium saccharobutylicum]AGX41092.1 transcription repressor NiaR [Clostridium saccharobutylicum DSM 13864]AQR88378.1 putative transcription repressor NiaR [Clostridium saccharobutylicum]AQR98276.1 putative transcription repressor NiaR [Clostridium saccharobutylicum]AQS07970.1 putative transcription repressor NiaR [Clostridium saccharobutylicum]AQS12266.1 putative transcription repressor NiaR [Clostridium saccharobutylicum]
MNSIERRDSIIKLLLESNKPLKGTTIAEKYAVTRQVIVKDIAILRAKGENIIATPDGYIVNNNEGKVKAIIAVTHDKEQMFEEMSIVIKYGGIIEDVIVEHPLYGEIKGMLMIKNFNELNKFIIKYKEQKAKLLSVLTNGVHLHTIAADTEDDIELIISELKERNFVVSD